MPAIAGSKIPDLRLHRKTGQAVVTLVNPRGGRRDYYLGKFGSDESRSAYQQLVGRWVAGDREHPDVRVPVAGELPLTLDDLTDRFMTWARGYYLHADRTQTGEVANLDRACTLLCEYHDKLRPADLTPNRLRDLRDKLLEREIRCDKDEQGDPIPGTGQRLSRTYVNSTIRRVRQVMKWAEARELVPAATFHRLSTVESLKAGRSPARESSGLRPVSLEHVEATIPHLPRQVAGLVWFCWFTAARMGEAVQLATRYVEMKGEVWSFRPPQHKGASRGKSKVIAIGRPAQAVLQPFISLQPDRLWFRPSDAVKDLHDRRHAARETPPPPREKTLARRKSQPQCAPSERYSTNSVQVAIRRACEKAGIPLWTPHCLRHARLTRIRAEHGIEAAAAVGGHWTLDVTEAYTQAAKERLAFEVARKMG